MIEVLLARYEYLLVVALLAIGVYMLVADRNLVKKIIGLNIFQTAVFLFFIAAAVREGGGVPLIGEGPYVNPLPHVLVLTAIVVGVSLTAAALALIVRIHATYGSLDEDVLGELIDG